LYIKATRILSTNTYRIRLAVAYNNITKDNCISYEEIIENNNYVEELDDL